MLWNLNGKNMFDKRRNIYQTKEWSFSQINPTSCKYYLHRLYGQLDEVQFLIFDLLCGTKIEIFGRKSDRVSVLL